MTDDPFEVLVPENEIMPFGKFKGVKLGDLPDDYLKWALEAFDDDKPIYGWLLQVWEGRSNAK